ncbi:MAG: IPT/TIG domain-containing protein [Blastocatellia bacterium]
MSKLTWFRVALITLLLIALMPVPTTYLAGNNLILKPKAIKAVLVAPLQSSNIKILAPNGKANPVVNQGNMLNLRVVDGNNQPVTGFSITSGSPDVVSVVDPAQGLIMGKKQGYATLTVRRGSETSSTFAIVTQVGKAKGAKVLGQSDQDVTGAIYLADPIKNQIFKVEDIQQPAIIYAGTGVKGKSDGERKQAQFAGPIGISVDDRSRNGIYVADTLNHSIRRISFDNKVETMLGTGTPGLAAALTSGDETFFTTSTDIALSGPQGVAIDTGGNIFVADTDNHAIYYVDFSKTKIHLVAGQPGRSGQADGSKREALFNSPTSISLSPDGSLLNVVDSGNNVIRQVSRDGVVITLGAVTPGAKTFSRMSTSEDLSEQSTNNQPFVFNKPISVTQDLFGTIYVTDQDGVDVIVPTKKGRQRFSLAQPGAASFAQPTSVNVRGTQVFVSDAAAINNDEAFKIVTIGAPTITSMSQDQDLLSGGAEVVLRGENFGPESRVFIGDNEVDMLEVVDATTIRLIVPPQKTPGKRTLTLQTRGGMAQKQFTIVAKPLSELVAGQITTIAGGIPFIGDGGLARAGLLFSPSGVAVDGQGNIYVSDENNNRIRKINTRSGMITTIAGNGAPDFNGDKGPAIVASLNKPAGLAIDLEGNIYVADRANSRVRKIDAITGNIDTIIGSGKRKIDARTEPQEGIDALKATIDPVALALTPTGDIFIADAVNNRIRVFINSNKKMITFVGSGEQGFKGDGGLAKTATLNNPTDLVFGRQGLLIADNGNGRVRLVAPLDINRAMISTIAGCGSPNPRDCRAEDNIPATQAAMKPIAVDVAASGDLVISDEATMSVRGVILSSNNIITLAGGRTATRDVDSGPALDVRIFPRAVAVVGDSNLVILDNDPNKAIIGKNRVRGFQLRIDSRTGARISTTFTLAGGGTADLGDDDLATNASLNVALSLALDSQDNIFIADLGNRRVREITSFDGKISTVSGGVVFDGRSLGDGDAANLATLFAPTSVVIDSIRLFIADAGTDRLVGLGDSRIRLVQPASGLGNIFTFAGGGNNPADGVLAKDAMLDPVVSIAIDKNANVFLLELDVDRRRDDNSGGRIKRIDGATGVIKVIAGTGEIGFSGDGGQAINARFGRPSAIAVDTNGNLFVADTGNDRIRRIDATTGIITTVVGGGTSKDEGILATQVSLGKPLGVLVDKDGNIFLSDTASSRVRVVEAKTNRIRTIAGKGRADIGGDEGAATSAGLTLPSGLALDSQGNLYIADIGNSSIRAIKGPIIAPKPVPAITAVNYKKPNLTISGVNFGVGNSVISINGIEQNNTVVGRTENTLSLRGNIKKLNLEKKEDNLITVTVDGIVSNTFIFQVKKSKNSATEEEE